MLEPDKCQPVASANAGITSRLQSTALGPAWLRFTFGMSELVPYAAFGYPRKVSVWIGDFLTAEDLDAYLCLSQEFEKDFGFPLSDRNMPETTVEPEPAAIQKLVSGFSWSESFRDAVAEAARRSGVGSATTMVVFHNFDYDPALVTVAAIPRLRFLGAFPYGEKA